MFSLFYHLITKTILNNTDVEKDKQESVIEFLETLEDDDDVQNVFSNANFGNN